jgi:hypothetical protein
MEDPQDVMALFLLTLLFGCSGEGALTGESAEGTLWVPTESGGATSTPGGFPSTLPSVTIFDTGVAVPDQYSFALIGDYGDVSDREASVAALVASFEPEAVVTAGDNNYMGIDGFDDAVGQFYSAWISPYEGKYGPGSKDNRFWPSIGNNDIGAGLSGYLDFFTLPGNERYYSVALHDDIDLFVVNSDDTEVDGITPDSKQGAWLKASLEASTAAFKVVLFHHAPYSSGSYRDELVMQWPWRAWGANLVLTGHEHDYERLVVDGVTHIVCGISGTTLRILGVPRVDSQVASVSDNGAVRLRLLEDGSMSVRVVGTSGQLLDEARLAPTHAPTAWMSLSGSGEVWSHRTSAPPKGWRLAGFDDSSWSSGPSPHGYGDVQRTELITEAVTTYHRRAFMADDPALFGALRLQLFADDGALVWLNGQEIVRANLPKSLVTPDTLAVALDFSPDWAAFDVSPDLLTRGENVLAVELHQIAPSDYDALFDAMLEGERSERWVSSGDRWRYRMGDHPGVGWTGLGHNDEGWWLGGTPLGEGYEGLQTVVDSHLEPLDRPITTWLRHSFEVDSLDGVEAVLVRLQRADGLQLFLNGQRVLRHDLPRGTGLHTDTPATAEVATGWESQWSGTVLPLSMWVEGDNVLAARLHRAGPDDGTIRFDLEVVPLR